MEYYTAAKMRHILTWINLKIYTKKKKKESYKSIRKMYTVECDLYKVKTHKRTLDIVQRYINMQ